MKFTATDRHFNGDWGVVELDALVDTHKGLEAALAIACIQHRNATYFRVVKNAETGGNGIELLWTGRDDATALPFPLKTAAQCADFVALWADTNGVWPTNRPDTDGSVHDGFRIKTAYSATLAIVECEWTVYGK